MSVLEERVRMKRVRLVKTFSPVMECPREILSDQSDISNVVILNPKAKLLSLLTTVH